MSLLVEKNTKNIPTCDRLIVALDVGTNAEAKALVESLGETVTFYKLGLQIFMGGEYFELIEWLTEKGKRVFVDLKFFDVPETVKLAVRELGKCGATFATVHGNDAILKAAVSEKKGIKILAVTALTSLDNSDLKDLGFQVNVKDLVLSRARRAEELGCDGVISSGLEASALREITATSFIIITPGIRPFLNSDDQKRTVDVEEAFLNGADYIVVGRPIKEHHGFDSSKSAAADIQRRIADLFTAS